MRQILRELDLPQLNWPGGNYFCGCYLEWGQDLKKIENRVKIQKLAKFRNQMKIQVENKSLSDLMKFL